MRFVHLGFAPDLVDYEQGWQTQREVHAQVVDGTLPDTTLLLEHAAVYTAGKRTEPHERPTDGTPVIDVDRGGKITWHGPGQLVGYPIVRLTQVPIDVVAHVRRLEDVMIRVCRDFGVETVRVDGRSGVWVLADDRGPDRKLGAIGVRVSRRVTMHGFALNCDADLSWADAIIPCGIADAGVSSLTLESGRPVDRAGRAALRREAPHRRPGLSRHRIRDPSHARRRLARVTVAPEGRRMLRVEARNAETPIERKPEWIRTTAKMGPEFTQIHAMVKGEGLHTVCQEAGCPNIFECWEDREATFLIGGDTCTRRCDFCDIATGRPQPLDLDEPRRVAESVRSMGLRYSTVTGVARDDQPDGAAGLYAETIRQIHALNPNTGVEILPPDFGAVPELVGQVFDARPEVFAHNLETVPRIFKRIRPAFTYDKSLRVLSMAREAELVTKSNLILGHGRGGPRDRGGDPRPARRGLRHPHDHPVPAPLPQAPPDRPVGQARGVRALVRRSRRTSASRASWPARWCAARTAPAGSGPPR